MDEAVSEAQSSFTSFQTALAQRYAIERELGRGGMATVYLARDIEHDRLVAVKLLLPELTASVGADRFLREIEVGRTLQHPGIVGVLDSGSAAGQLYYVMPFVDGQSLRDRLDREKQLPIDDALQIISQVADALSYAHGKGVVHRDIKPENILLGRERAMLADFGIAHAVSMAGGDTLTRTGMTVGTPTYMSPEQATQSRDVTAESDIYSLACVLYETLAGQPPFTGPTAMALLARHSLDQVPSLKIVRGTIPDAVEDAISRAMAKVPADRFRTASEFATALRDDVSAAEKRRNSMRASTAARRGSSARRMGLIAAAVVLPLAAIGGWMTWNARRASATPEGVTGDFAKSSIAVLYFRDRTPGKQLDYVADGLTEALIRDLTGVEQLKVISRNGVAPLRGKDIAPDSIARLLKVGTVVEGTVNQVGDSLRVTVDLTDALSGKSINSVTVSRPRSEVIALQDSLAADLALALRQQVGVELAQLVNRAGTSNAAAWEAMERAQRTVAGADPLLADGNVAAASRQLAAADTQLAAVEALDGSWARPITQRGWLAYRQSRLLGPSDPSSIPKWIETGLGHAGRALALAPNDADALELRGTLRYWRWLLNLSPDAAAAKQLLADAQADLTASTKANPLQASAFNSLSHLLMARSQTAEAKLAANTAYDADPYLTDVDKTVWRLFNASIDLDNYNESVKWCGIGAARFPSNYRFIECRMWLSALDGGPKPDVAALWKTYDAYVKGSPANLQEFDALKGKMIVALGLVHAGLADSARNVAKSGRASTKVDPTGELLYLESIVAAQLGDKDAAIGLLTRYMAANPQQAGASDHDESWWLQALKDDSRYKSLIGRAR